MSASPHSLSSLPDHRSPVSMGVARALSRIVICTVRSRLLSKATMGGVYHMPSTKDHPHLSPSVVSSTIPSPRIPRQWPRCPHAAGSKGHFREQQVFTSSVLGVSCCNSRASSILPAYIIGTQALNRPASNGLALLNYMQQWRATHIKSARRHPDLYCCAVLGSPIALETVANAF